jgi:hypothetical protein
MYCQKCGADNLENATMCQSCGGVFVYSQPTRTSGMAITSMILGISGFSLLGVFGITGIIGLVFGIIALGRIGKSSGQLKGKGFAITGIATSAAGLALWLTVFGVLLFVNSATTISILKKIKMYDNSAATVVTDEKPSLKGWVYVFSDNPSTICKSSLFTSQQIAATDLAITSYMTCEPKGGEPVRLSWQFVGKKNKNDVYDFIITVPVGDNSTGVGKKTIMYDGSAEQVVFEDQQRKVVIAPVTND